MMKRYKQYQIAAELSESGEPMYLCTDVDALLAKCEEALREVWESVPATYKEDDPMVIRHAKGLNNIVNVLTAIRAARVGT
jgi:hypothetical protein